ncbi:protein jagged-2-like [Bolinopsis microptera]|uniref:protein jagged-2-like n=1 Tax=Bolinopsis microptera TaxID=2820187 RepID=UPI003079CB79
MLGFIATLLILPSVIKANCDSLGDAENVASMVPFEIDQYEEDTEVLMTCRNNFIISWAASVEDISANVRCNSGNFSPEPQVDSFGGTVGCVACVEGVADCTDGTCTDGTCECKQGFERADHSDPRLCTVVQCHSLTLTNQAADTPGPYDVNSDVIVTCSDGFHVTGTGGTEHVQTLTCDDGGNFNPVLKSCVMCSDSDGCTGGICNANKQCECDETDGYKLSADDLSVCEKVLCTDDHCSNNGMCSVKGAELECDCPTGTTGDTCANFNGEPCGEDPCKNGGACSRDMSDPLDYSKHTCSCTTGFTGHQCEEVADGPSSENEDESEDDDEDDNEEDDEDEGKDNSTGCICLGNAIRLLVATAMLLS